VDVDQVKLRLRREAGRELTALVWRFPGPVRALASGPLGGGVGLRRWVLLAQVSPAIERRDPATHLTRLAVSLGLAGRGVGLVTTGDLRSALRRAENGVVVVASVASSGRPVERVPPSSEEDRLQAGRVVRFVDLLVGLPAPVADAELVRAATVVTSVAAACLGYPDLGRQPGPLRGLCVVCPDGPETGAGDGDAGWAQTAGRVVESVLRVESGVESRVELRVRPRPRAEGQTAQGRAGSRRANDRPDRWREGVSVPSGYAVPSSYAVPVSLSTPSDDALSAGTPLGGGTSVSGTPVVRPAERGGARRC